jgi:protein TonB
MGHPAKPPTDPSWVLRPAPAPQSRLFDDALIASRSLRGRRSAAGTLSLVFHAIVALLVILVPLWVDDTMPEVTGSVRAFFVSPPEAPPPPPPPPPKAPARAVANRPVTQATPPPANAFVAPVDVPTEVTPEAGLDLGIEGGIEGGVEGGVPGGVAGGIVGGLPAQPQEAPPARVVRVGGSIIAPKLVRRVEPEYPSLAVQARLSALIILEAHVDTRGQVRDVKVLRGAPLFDEAAIAAVKQWRYQPLLLNGTPTEFLLTVTVNFNLTTQGQPQG